MKIPEPEQEDNYIDDRMLGNIIHHTLENLFFPFIDKSIAIEDLKVMKAKMPVEVMECAKKEARGQILDSGQNLLTLKGIEKYLDRYFEEEVVSHSKNIKSGGSWRINGLEEKLERSINLPSRNQDIKLFGFVDRLDSWNGTHRVLDYKTGAVSATSLKNIDFKELFHDSKYDKSVQLLSYAWLLNNRYPNKDLQSGIIAIRNTNDPYVFLGGSDQKKISEEELSLFEQELLQFLEGLFNPNIPFNQTEEKKNCQYCPYMNICLK